MEVKVSLPSERTTFVKGALQNGLFHSESVRSGNTHPLLSDKGMKLPWIRECTHCVLLSKCQLDVHILLLKEGMEIVFLKDIQSGLLVSSIGFVKDWITKNLRWSLPEHRVCFLLILLKSQQGKSSQAYGNPKRGWFWAQNVFHTWTSLVRHWQNSNSNSKWVICLGGFDSHWKKMLGLLGCLVRLR